MSRFKQRDLTDCGAACFAFVCEHYRLRLSIARVRQELGTDQVGTSAAALVHGARRLGFSAKGVKGPAEALGTVPLPAIAHCLVDGRLLHYVVLVEWTARRARVMDPAVGRVETWLPDRFKAVWTGVLVLLAPAAEFQPVDRLASPWRRLGRLLHPHGTLIVQAGVGALASTILGLATSIYVQKIVDAVIPEGNRALLNLLGVAMLAVLGFRVLLGWFQSLLSLRLAQRIDAGLITGYYRHLLRLPQPFFDTMRVGEITSRVADAMKIRHFLNGSLLNLVLNPLIVAFSLAAMFWWSWQLALLSVALVPGYALIYATVNRLNRVLQRRLMERAADFDAQLVESLNSQSVIRAFGLEADAALRVETKLVRLLRTGWSSALGGAAGGAAIQALAQAHLITLLWLGAGLVLGAGISPGQLMSCYALAGHLSGPVTALVGMNGTVQDALIATDRLFEIMDLEREADLGTAELPEGAGAEIRFEQVSFRHSGRAAGLVELDLVFAPGKITVLTGDSGCGKSTILALIQRLYAPLGGRVLIGGLDIRHLRLDSLRRQLAVVPQHTQLLTGTLLQNLAPGAYQPDLRRLVEICRSVGILAFIESLPQGFLTHLTENGANLSGGQRQRLAWARALYLDAPFLLLDEPTAALDREGELRLVGLLADLKSRGRTIVLATHSPALAAIADCRYLLREGRRVENPGPAPAVS
jgi:ATP-binding cassette, subfamily C, bacteriocin exporter